jgi:hypothetical protein
VIKLSIAAPVGPVSQSLTIACRVTEDATGVARLEIQVDSGSVLPVAPVAPGPFRLVTALAYRHSRTRSPMPARLTSRSGS